MNAVTDSDDADNVTAIADRLRRIDACDATARGAVNTLAPVIRDLPATDDLLLSPQVATAWRTLRQHAPDTFLIYRSQVGRKCGRALVDLIDHHIGPPATGAVREIRLLTPGDVRNRPLGSDIVQDVLPSQGLCGIIGGPGAGKSAFVDHIVCSLAANRAPLPGRRFRPVASLIVAAEGRRRARLQAWGDHFHVNVDTLPLRFIEQGIDLRSPAGEIDRLLQLIDVAESDLGQIGVTVIDTLARTFGGGSENDSAPMGEFLHNMQRIAERTGGVVVVLHHVGKDASRGARGHGSLLGASDAEIIIERQDDDMRIATISKLREGADGQQVAFRLAVVDLGVHPDPDASGQAWSSVVAVPIADHVRESKGRRHKLPAGAQVALDALKSAISRHGEYPAGAAMIDRNQTVAAEHWRAEYEAMRPVVDSDPDARKQRQARRMAFNRAQDQLQAARIVGTNAGKWWTQ